MLGLPRLLLHGTLLLRTNAIHSAPTSCLFRLVPLLRAAVQLSTATVLIAQEIIMWSMMLMAIIALALEGTFLRVSNFSHAARSEREKWNPKLSLASVTSTHDTIV